MAQIIVNNLDTTLSATITANSTILSLQAGDVAAYGLTITTPATQWFYVTLKDKNGNREIVKIIDTDGDDLIVGDSADDSPAGSTDGRGQESTTPLAITHTDDHAVQGCVTAGMLTAWNTHKDGDGSDHADVASNTDNLIVGDGTAGRKLRSIRLTIQYAALADINVTVESNFNGDTQAATDLDKGGSSGILAYSADGKYLTINTTGNLVGNAPLISSLALQKADSAEPLFPKCTKLSNQIKFELHVFGYVAAQDFSAVFGVTGYATVIDILYMTDS